MYYCNDLDSGIYGSEEGFVKKICKEFSEGGIRNCNLDRRALSAVAGNAFRCYFEIKVFDMCDVRRYNFSIL